MRSDDRVLTITEATEFLGLKSRSSFYRDPVWPTLVTRPTRGRAGILLSVLHAELARRQGPRPFGVSGRGRRPRTAEQLAAACPAPTESTRGYVRRRRRIA